MTFGSTQCGEILNVITQNVIWANQKTVFRSLRARAMFDVMCFAAFVGASNVKFKRSIVSLIVNATLASDVVID